MFEVITPETCEINGRSYLPTGLINTAKIFLAGSIEMGAAIDWQKEAIDCIKTHNASYQKVLIFNPRRENWDSTWKQDIDFQPFRNQVEWELAAIQQSDCVIFYFDPNTKSPITLMELGLVAGLEKSVAVVCPEGFWRKGNVDILCATFGIPIFKDLKNAIDCLI